MHFLTLRDFEMVQEVKIIPREKKNDSFNLSGRKFDAWWRHQMETFSALLAICAGNSPVTGEFPAQRPVTRSFDVFLDLHLNKRLSKQSWGWWFETLSRPLWRHSNGSGRARSRGISSYGTDLVLNTGRVGIHSCQKWSTCNNNFSRRIILKVWPKKRLFKLFIFFYYPFTNYT